jgi:ribose/xylose/arabinose/galactoside ABC-type transport system permease subunit
MADAVVTPARPAGATGLVRAIIRRPEAGVVLVILALGAFLSIANPKFLSIGNIMNIAKNYSDIGIGAVGMTLVLLTGGIDLSVASNMALGGLVTAFALTSWGLPIPIAMLLGVASGGVIGAVSGILIQRLRLPPFIATLGMLGVARGIVVGTTSGMGVSGLPKEFLSIGQGYIGVVPVPVIVMIIVALVVGLFLATHLWGTYIYSIGGNETAARLTGLPVARVKIFVYVACGLLGSLAGVLVVSRLGVSLPGQSLGYELQVIAAAVIGGVSLTGGRGTILGAVLGAMIIGLIQNALVLLTVPPYWQQSFIGGIIILAAVIDILRDRRSRTS